MTPDLHQTLDDIKAALGGDSGWEASELRVASWVVPVGEADGTLAGESGWAQTESAVWILENQGWRRVSGRDSGNPAPASDRLLTAEIRVGQQSSLHLRRQGPDLWATALTEGQAPMRNSAAPAARHVVMARTGTFLATEKGTNGELLRYRARVYRRVFDPSTDSFGFHDGFGPAWRAWAWRFCGWETR